jgi:hypothetical protein
MRVQGERLVKKGFKVRHRRTSCKRLEAGGVVGGVVSRARDKTSWTRLD